MWELSSNSHWKRNKNPASGIWAWIRRMRMFVYSNLMYLYGCMYGSVCLYCSFLLFVRRSSLLTRFLFFIDDDMHVMLCEITITISKTYDLLFIGSDSLTQYIPYIYKKKFVWKHNRITCSFFDTLSTRQYIVEWIKQNETI